MTLVTSAFQKKGHEVIKGHKLRKKVKFQTSFKVGKSYIKMTLVTSAFPKNGSRGQQRSPMVKKGHSRSKIPKKGQISNFDKIS